MLNAAILVVLAAVVGAASAQVTRLLEDARTQRRERTQRLAARQAEAINEIQPMLYDLVQISWDWISMGDVLSVPQMLELRERDRPARKGVILALTRLDNDELRERANLIVRTTATVLRGGFHPGPPDPRTVMDRLVELHNEFNEQAGEILRSLT